MATSRINFANMSDDALKKLSDYNVAYWNLRSLRDTFKAESEKLETEKQAILDNRKNDIDAGIPLNDCLVKWSTVEVDKKISALAEKYAKDCEPYKATEKASLALIDDQLYYGYLNYVRTGSTGSKGTVTIKKGKSTSEVTMDKSYVDMVKDFLYNIGAEKQDDTKALNKFVNIMIARSAGVAKCNKGDDYIKVKSASQFKDIFMIAFLQYMVIERGLLVANDLQELSVKVIFED